MNNQNETNLPSIAEESEAPQVSSAGMALQSRAMQEVQAAFVVAKRFPRDTVAAHKRILDDCRRMGLAEKSVYAYKRGSTMVTGPSIRLAEAIAKNWGNLSTGITELENRDDESVLQAYCIDMETNYEKRVTFSVKHERSSSKGITKLTDQRDRYENAFNYGARRLRACILAVIPGDIVEEAVEQCNKTMAGKSDVPLIDRARAMLPAFNKIGVSQEMIEKRLGHKLEAVLEPELVVMRQIFNSVQEGMSKPSDWFDMGVPGGGKAEALTDKLKAEAEQKAQKKEGAKAPVTPEAKADPEAFKNFSG